MTSTIETPALLVASGAIAAIFYLIPSLHLWRGVAALAVFGTGCAVLASRLVFARVIDQEIFKKRVLVYGAGAAAGRGPGGSGRAAARSGRRPAPAVRAAQCQRGGGGHG